MSLTEHLTELRRRIIWIVAMLVVSMIGGFFLSVPVLDFLKGVGHAKDTVWHALSPGDSIRIYMQLAFFIAVGITLPFTLYQLWAFVRPGLHPAERKATLKYIPISVLLFLAGVAFAYLVVFQMALEFAIRLNRSLHVEEMYGINQYFSFMLNIVMPVALLFELPVLIMFLTKLRILNPLRLKKMRRYAYFVLVVLSTLIAPPDLMSNLLIVLPLILLYELSVTLSRRIYRKQLEAEKRWEAEYGAK